MTTRFAASYNAINLLRNGGLDFVKDAVSVPPFWAVEGATGGAVPPTNSFSIVTGEDPKVEAGAARYFKFVVANTTPVVLAQEFLSRFIQPAFTEALTKKWKPDDHRMDRYQTLGCQLITGKPLTVSFSIRVLKGSVGVQIRMEMGRLQETSHEYRTEIFRTEDVVAVTASASSEWRRVSVVIDPGVYVLGRLGLVIEKSSSVTGLSEAHVGAIQLSTGSIGDLPYTGDPMADVFPKGMIVFAFGDACPPGFEKLSFAEPHSGRVFFKDAKPVSLSAEGEEIHNHEEATMAMNPELDWPKLYLVPTPYGQAYGVTPDSAAEEHTHTLSKANHVPTTRDVILCRRL